jgi:hypothetical protein
MQMKGKSRQEVVREILRTYGNVDHVDAICLGVRFKCSPEVITEDVRSAGETLKQEALAQKRAAQLAEQRRAELEVARKILRKD